MKLKTLKFTALFCGMILLGNLHSAQAQERVVMPDRQSIELAGQIEGLKQIISGLMEQIAGLQALEASVTNIEDSLTEDGLLDPSASELEVGQKRFTTDIIITDRDYSGSYEGCTIVGSTEHFSIRHAFRSKSEWRDGKCKSRGMEVIESKLKGALGGLVKNIKDGGVRNADNNDRQFSLRYDVLYSRLVPTE